MTGVGPFAQGSLDEAFRLAVGPWGIGSSEAVADTELGARSSEQVRAIGVAVVREQATDGDAVLRIKVYGST